ncbi:MAG: hypothetical protein RI935_635 [Candidatus Parcubacteria bacterium]
MILGVRTGGAAMGQETTLEYDVTGLTPEQQKVYSSYFDDGKRIFFGMSREAVIAAFEKINERRNSANQDSSILLELDELEKKRIEMLS